MLWLGIFFVAASVFCAVWYWVSRRRTRSKAVQVVGWIEAALAGQGHVLGMRGTSPREIKGALRGTVGGFHRAWVPVGFCTCEMPINWIVSKLRNQQDTITFQADLDFLPSFSLDVHNFRWFARSSRKTDLTSSRWTFQQSGPFVISTRMNWQKEITSAMMSLTNTNNR